MGATLLPGFIVIPPTKSRQKNWPIPEKLGNFIFVLFRDLGRKYYKIYQMHCLTKMTHQNVF